MLLRWKKDSKFLVSSSCFPHSVPFTGTSTFSSLPWHTRAIYATEKGPGMGFAHKLDLSEQVFLLVSQGKERFSLSFGSEMAQKKVTIQGRRRRRISTDMW